MRKREPKFQFMTRDGATVKGSEFIFPLLKSIDGQIYPVGTGFYIARNGIFITAKHVLEDVIDEKTGKQKYGMAAMHQFPNNKYYLRVVKRVYLSNEADIAIGTLDQLISSKGEPLVNKVPTLTTNIPELNSEIITWAYPRSEARHTGTKQEVHFYPAFYEGRLLEHFPKGRDSCVMPFQCFRGSIPLYKGASGGPVFDLQSRIFAINCSSIDGQEDIAYFTSIEYVLNLWLEKIIIPQLGKESRRVSIMKLAKLGHITFEPKIDPKAEFKYPDGVIEI